MMKIKVNKYLCRAKIPLKESLYIMWLPNVEKYYQLNETGWKIVEVLIKKTGNKINNILKELKEKFLHEYKINISEKALEKDILGFLYKLDNMKFIQIEGKYKKKNEKILKSNLKASTIEKISLQNFFPLSVHIDLTNRCNLNCFHCYNKNAFSNHQELKFEEIKSLLFNLKELGTMRVYLSGGEISLRNDLPQIINFARKLGFEVTLSTNLSLWNDKLTQVCEDTGLYKIATSLYGITPYTHEFVTRVKGSFKHTWDTIHTLLEENFKIIIRYIIFEHNYDEFKKAKKYFKKYPNAEISGTPVLQPKLNNPAELFERYKKYLLKGDKLIEYFRVYSNVREKLPLNDFPYCNAGKNKLYISPSGEIWPCFILPFNIGNVRNESIEKAWFNSPLLSLWRSFRNDIYYECRGCRLRKFCQFRCPGHCYLRTGSIFKNPPEICELAKILEYTYKLGQGG